jgi:hypothetical protein
MKHSLTPSHLRLIACLPAMILASSLAAAAEEAPAPANEAARNAKLEEALEKLKLPGVQINLKEKCVDVASTICLREGALELIACTKDTKEHESVIMIEAVPKHVHAALLLIGAKPGSPAMRKPIDKEGTRWMDVPPSGGPVDVYLLVPDKEGKLVERPINDFIVANREESGQAAEDAKPERFPTHTFLFAGSILHKPEDGPPQYIADGTGSVISITTFGDELLCLPEFHDRSNEALMWQIDSTHLPPVGTKITLRLRPQFKEKPAVQGEKTPAKVTQ